MSDLPLFDYARARRQACTPRAPARQVPGSAPADTLPDDVVRIFHLLRSRIGKFLAIKAADIATALDLLPDRKRDRRGDYVRRLINAHKLDAPFVIIADPANGFYRPAGPDDLEHFFAAQRSRIREIALNAKATRLQAQREGYIRTGSTSWSSPGRG